MIGLAIMTGFLMSMEISSSVSPNGQKLPFFRSFFDHCNPDMIGVSWTKEDYVTPSEYWCEGFSDDQLTRWKERAKQLTSKEIVEKYFDKKELMLSCNGGIVAIPTKYFMAHRRWDIKFIVTASQHFADQELGLSLYNSLGNPLFEIFPWIKTCNF